MRGRIVTVNGSIIANVVSVSMDTTWLGEKELTTFMVKVKNKGEVSYISGGDKDNLFITKEDK